MRRSNDSSGKSRCRSGRLNNADRSAQTTAAIEAKVIVLEAIANKEKPPVEGLPNSIATFRAWKNEALGLTVIGSPGSTNEKKAPHNKSLVDRALKAMRSIGAQLRSRKLRVYVPVGGQLEELQAEHRQLLEEHRRMLSELAMYIHRATSAELRCPQDS